MEIVNHCSNQTLNLDQACVTLTNYAFVPDLFLYTLSSDCHDCPYTRNVNFSSKSINVKVDTARSQFWRIIRTDGREKYISASSEIESYCQINPDIGQYGIYELVVHENKTCNFYVNVKSINPYTPLVASFGLLMIFLSCLSIFKLIKRKVNAERPITSRSQDEDTKEKIRNKRLRSLDAVRGASILLMIFVNNGAGNYPFLEHATWNGLYVGDLVFPCFMWIMGVCIPLSISSVLSRGNSKLTVCWSIVKRSFYLFLIGMSLNTLGKTQLENIRIFGVLQRFSIAYLVVGITYTLSFWPNDEKKWKDSWKTYVADFFIMMPQWAVAFFILSIHCLLIFKLNVPNCPKGYFGPGGLDGDGKYWNCTGGAVGYVDKILLGESHVYQYPTMKSVYKSGSFEPEGILGCLPSIFQVFLGVHAGIILRMYKAWHHRLIRWLSWAVLFGVSAVTLHYANYIPINKNLWSVSFVFITTCFSLGLLSIFYLTIDVIGIWNGGPFRIPGMNALVMFIGHQIFSAIFPFRWKYGKMNTHSWLLAENLWSVMLWTFVAYVLHWKKIYVRL